MTVVKPEGEIGRLETTFRHKIAAEVGHEKEVIKTDYSAARADYLNRTRGKDVT